MASELLSSLLWANVTLSIGILIVFALRIRVRRFAGSRVAYALWLLPPLAFLAWLAPARQVTMAVALPLVDGSDSVMAVTPAGVPALLIVSCWLIGVAGMMAMFALRQRQFVRSAGSLQPVAELGRGVFSGAPSHGPAVVGALRPIIVLPRDFDARFSAEEQALVLAHERAHLDRLDPIINAAAMGSRAVNWFNPLVHIAARALRIDQELACDAAVLARHSGAQRAYAEAMLKSHVAAFDVPVGCAWHTAAFHPLKERILMLKSSPSRLSRGLGLSLVAAAAFGVCGAVWLMRPVEVLAAPTQEEPLSVVGEQALRDAVIEAREAEIEAQDAEMEARQTKEDALRDALGAAAARREAALGVRQAAKEARAAIAAAQMAMKDAEPAIAAAREAMRDVRPAIAAAQQALRDAQPAIAAARQEAARHARWAMIDARRAAACQRALARWPSFDFSTEGQLRALEKLVCIPGPAKRPVPAPEE